MSDDLVTLNVTPESTATMVERIPPVDVHAAVRAIGDQDADREHRRQMYDAEGKERNGVELGVEEGTFDQLEAQVVAANRQFHDHGIAVSLRLHRDEEKGIHLEIEDHRAAEHATVHLDHIIEHHEITRLINDLLGEVGICIDTTV